MLAIIRQSHSRGNLYFRRIWPCVKPYVHRIQGSFAQVNSNKHPEHMCLYVRKRVAVSVSLRKRVCTCTTKEMA